MPRQYKDIRPLTQAEKRKARDKEYRRRKQILKKFGIYEPKGVELTRYRKHEINRYWSEFHDVVTRPEKYLIAKPSKSLTTNQKRKALAKAKEMDVAYVTKKTVILPREGYTGATIRYSKKDDEAYIIRRGKVKHGINKGKRYTDHLSLAGLDGLEKVKDKLKRQSKRLGPLKEGQVYVFKVIVKGETYGYSHSNFENLDLLTDYVLRYHNNIPQQISFARLIHIEKHMPFEWNRDRPRPLTREQRRRLRLKGRT